MKRGIAMIISALVLAACGSARRSEPLVGPFRPMSAEVVRGERVFMERCHQCHPGGEAGLGPALNNKPLPGSLIKLQVREGIGAMPAFSARDITPDALGALVAYIAARRQE